jgi:hypothetical protein
MSVTAFNRMRRVAAEKAAEQKPEKPQEEKPINKMTVAELEAFAEQNKIELPEKYNKAELLAIIEKALEKRQE